MAHASHDIVATPFVADGNRSVSSSAARRQRMLRELGCVNDPCSADAYPQFRLRAEATKLKAAIRMVWEAGETKRRIEPSVPAKRGNRESRAGFESEHQGNDATARRDEELLNAAGPYAAGRAHADVISQALEEMMARVQAEQQATIERWTRAAPETARN